MASLNEVVFLCSITCLYCDMSIIMFAHGPATESLGNIVISKESSTASAARVFVDAFVDEFVGLLVFGYGAIVSICC